MKVLMVTPYFPPHVGGMEVFVYKLSNRLYEKGIEVEVLTTKIPSEYNLDTPYRVERVNPGIVLMRNPIVFELFKKIKYLKSFDVIHAHDEHAFATNIVALSKNKYNKPLIIHSHGLFYPESFLESIVASLYNATLGKWSLKRADKVIALSRNDGKFIENLGVEREKIEVIPNAIDPRDYDLNIDPEDFADKHELQGWKIVLYVGAIIKRKGLNYLIRAVSMLDNRSKVKLLVIGDGGYRRECEKLVQKLNLQKNVVFLGRVSREDLMKAFKIADVFVLPSLVEGVPTVILEAYLYEKPVVAFDIPEVAEYFRNSALLVPPKNVEMLAQAINRVLTEPEAARENVKKGKKVLTQNFIWDKTLEKIIKVYENLLSR